MAWLGAFALAGQVGCGARQPAPAPVPPAPPPPVTLPTPAVAPPEPEHAPGRLLDAAPSELPPELAEQVAFLSDLCAVALHYEVEGAHRVTAGCRSCPPFEGAGALPDGKIAIDGAEFFALEVLLGGHFSDATSEQRLAVFNGCEPHSVNYGGTVLAEQQDGHFRVRKYFSGLHPQSCQAFRRADGQDLAVCEFADVHQSVSTDELSVLDFSQDPPTPQALLSFTNHDLCLSPLGTRGAEEQVIESFELKQNGVPKNNGLFVHIASTTRVMTEAYQRYCQDDSGAAHERPYAKTRLITRRFVYDGQRFRAQ